MRITDSHVLTALTRARAFIERHATRLAAIETAGYRRELDVVIATLEQNAVRQDAARRMSAGELARQRALYSALRLNHMRRIVAIAAASREAIPELGALSMPSRKARPATLVAAAGAMAIGARQHAPEFIAAGLPADFVEQLEAAAQSLAQCITDRGTTLSERSGVTAALRRAAKRGRHVLAVLGSMIEPLIADDEPLLAEWKTARHVARPPRTQAVPFLSLLSMANLAPVQELSLPPAPAVPTDPQPSSGLGGVFTRVVRAFAGQTPDEVTAAGAIAP